MSLAAFSAHLRPGRVFAGRFEVIDTEISDDLLVARFSDRIGKVRFSIRILSNYHARDPFGHIGGYALTLETDTAASREVDVFVHALVRGLARLLPRVEDARPVVRAGPQGNRAEARPSEPLRPADLSRYALIDAGPASEVTLAQFHGEQGAFSMGLLALSGALEDACISHRVLDFSSVSRIPDVLVKLLRHAATSLDLRLEEVDPLLESSRDELTPYLDVLLDGDEPLIGFCVYQTSLMTTLWMAREIKKRDPGRLIVLGGPEMDMVSQADYCALSYIDAVVVGEGEETLVQLVRHLRSSRDFADLDLPGLHTRTRHSLVHALAPWPRLLSYAPLFRLPQTSSVWRDDVLHIPVQMSRGCVHRCAFCTPLRHFRTCRGHTPELFSRQVEILRTCAADREFFLDFADCNINHDWQGAPRVFESLAEQLGRSYRGACGFVTLDRDMTPGRIDSLVRAGFNYLVFGLESAAGHIRREMRKPGSLDVVSRLIPALYAAGIPLIEVAVIVGWPSETDKDFEETLAFLERFRGYPLRIALMPFIAYHGFDQFPELGLGTPGNRGMLWRADCPAGAPELRFSRLLRVQETFGDCFRILHPLHNLELVKPSFASCHPAT